MSSEITPSHEFQPIAGHVPLQSRLDLAALASEQRVIPVDDPARLGGDFWPADESLDDFLAMVKASRREETP